jgi:hypothetical protein
MSYFKENYNKITKMINEFVDCNPAEYKLINDEMISEFKLEVLWDYTEFLYSISYLTLDVRSNLYNHWKYSEQLNNQCKQLDGLAPSSLPTETINKFLNVLRVNMKDWYKNKLSIELKGIEKKHYTTLAFDYKNDINPSDYSHSRINQLKQEAGKNMKHKFNY